MSSCLRGTGSDESLLCLRSSLPWNRLGCAGSSGYVQKAKAQKVSWHTDNTDAMAYISHEDRSQCRPFSR